MFTRLKNILLRSQKEYLASTENIILEHHLSGEQILTRYSKPFDCIVIDNFFNNETYDGICSYYNILIKRGLSDKPSNNQFYPFKYVTGYLEKYGGYFYPPKFQEDTYMDIFFSIAFNSYIEKLTHVVTNMFLSTTIHFHTAGNKDGWVHNDYQKVFFHNDDKLSNGMIFQNNSRTTFTHSTMRAIGVIYYFNNNWKDGDGGETGIYENPKESPVFKVEPKNNRILIFPIKKNSFHAFLGNNIPRNAIVSWYHTDSKKL
jgi:hypothetical protein